MRQSKCVGLCTIAAIALLTAGVANAVIIFDSTTVPLSGTTSAARPELAGPIIEDVLLPYSMSNGIGGVSNGFIQNRVVRETSTGLLDFYYRFIPDANSNLPITALRTSGFAGFTMDVDYRIDSIGVSTPDSAHAFGGALTGYVNFLFNGPAVAPVPPTTESKFMFVHTTATSYALTGATDLDSFVDFPDIISNSVPTFAPVVPEPASVLMLFVGGLGFLARRRSV